MDCAEERCENAASLYALGPSLNGGPRELRMLAYDTKCGLRGDLVYFFYNVTWAISSTQILVTRHLKSLVYVHCALSIPFWTQASLDFHPCCGLFSYFCLFVWFGLWNFLIAIIHEMIMITMVFIGYRFFCCQSIVCMHSLQWGTVVVLGAIVLATISAYFCHCFTNWNLERNLWMSMAWLKENHGTSTGTPGL